jgi:hypothetical protein
MNDKTNSKKLSLKIFCNPGVINNSEIENVCAIFDNNFSTTIINKNNKLLNIDIVMTIVVTGISIFIVQLIQQFAEDVYKSLKNNAKKKSKKKSENLKHIEFIFASKDVNVRAIVPYYDMEDFKNKIIKLNQLSEIVKKMKLETDLFAVLSNSKWIINNNNSYFNDL